VRPNASKHRADNANKYRAKRPAPPLKTADLPLRYSENGASWDPHDCKHEARKQPYPLDQ